ncbi:Rieske (2Fe-2S) protein [Arthrobacter sp. JSM 101049]|uniref:Rieske (2Fe-2S) protein n=1 Tax=Arthrobacter sp. JSM 101049 TaxID=929097 RepID=UPI0035696D8B
MEQFTAHATGRRTILGGTLAVGAGAALAACGGGNEPQAIPDPTGQPAKATTTADLPVGGSLSVAVQGDTYLLYRQDESTVLAYTAICTHQGCTVGLGKNDFKCPCHGSEFSHEDGSPVAGPAKKPLGRYAAAIDGQDVLIYL